MFSLSAWRVTEGVEVEVRVCTDMYGYSVSVHMIRSYDTSYIDTGIHFHTSDFNQLRYDTLYVQYNTPYVVIYDALSTYSKKNKR